MGKFKAVPPPSASELAEILPDDSTKARRKEEEEMRLADEREEAKRKAAAAEEARRKQEEEKRTAAEREEAQRKATAAAAEEARRKQEEKRIAAEREEAQKKATAAAAEEARRKQEEKRLAAEREEAAKRAAAAGGAGPEREGAKKELADAAAQVRQESASAAAARKSAAEQAAAARRAQEETRKAEEKAASVASEKAARQAEEEKAAEAARKEEEKQELQRGPTEQKTRDTTLLAPNVSPPSFRFYQQPGAAGRNEEVPTSPTRPQPQQVHASRHEGRLPLASYLRSWTSAYDRADAANPGGLGKTVDVSRIFNPKGVSSVEGGEHLLHASYVDKIVHALDKDVRTGTGQACKAPVQLKNSLWAPGYATKAASHMGANQKVDMVRIYGKRDPITDYNIQNRLSGQTSGLGIDEEIAQEVGSSYHTFDEAHFATYTPKSNFVKPYVTRVTVGQESVAYNMTYRVTGERRPPVNNDAEADASSQGPTDTLVGHRGYAGPSTTVHTFVKNDAWNRQHEGAALKVIAHDHRFGQGRPAASTIYYSPERESASNFRTYVDVSEVRTPVQDTKSGRGNLSPDEQLNQLKELYHGAQAVPMQQSLAEKLRRDYSFEPSVAKSSRHLRGAGKLSEARQIEQETGWSKRVRIDECSHATTEQRQQGVPE